MPKGPITKKEYAFNLTKETKRMLNELADLTHRNKSNMVNLILAEAFDNHSAIKLTVVPLSGRAPVSCSFEPRLLDMLQKYSKKKLVPLSKIVQSLIYEYYSKYYRKVVS